MSHNFKEYLKTATRSVAVDKKFKATLFQHLFPSKKRTLFWSRYKWFFTLPVAAAFGLVLFFSPQSSEAVLARALENTFHFDLFETNLGFPNDHQFRHRKVDYFLQFKDQGKPVEMHQQANIWYDGDNFRQDHSIEVNSSNEVSEEFFSVMASLDDETVCSIGEEYIPDGSPCISLDAFLNQSNAHPNKYAPVVDDGLLAIEGFDVKKEVQEVKKGEKKKKVNVYTVEFSTTTPLDPNKTAVILGNGPEYFNRQFYFFDGLDEEDYFNHPFSGRYLHSISFMEPRPVDLYFQLLETEKPLGNSYEEIFELLDENINAGKGGFVDTFGVHAASSIFEIDLGKQLVKEIQLDFPEYSAISLAKKELLLFTMDSVIYMNKNANSLTLLSTEVLEKNEESVQVYHYLISDPEDMLGHISPLVSGSFELDIYLDESGEFFKGHTIYVDGEVLESLWLEDDFPDSPVKDVVFNSQKWEKSIDER